VFFFNFIQGFMRQTIERERMMKKIILTMAITALAFNTTYAKHCDESVETKKYPSIGFFKDLDNEYCAAIHERVEILKKLNTSQDQRERDELKKNLDENNSWVQELFGEKVLKKITAVDAGKEDFTPGKKKPKKSNKSNEFVIDHVMGWEEGSWNIYKAAEGIDSDSPSVTGEQKPEKLKKQRFWQIKKWNAKRKLRWVRLSHLFEEGFFQDLSRRESILEQLKDAKITSDQSKSLRTELSGIDKSIAMTCPECHQLFVDAEEVPADEFATRKVSEKKRKDTETLPTAPISKDYDGPADGGKVFDDSEGQGDWKPIPKGDF
jgi:hypothetical protein